MTTKTLCLIVALLSAIMAHPMCRDTTGPQQTTNTFCTDYSGDTCCSTTADSDKQTLFEGLGIQDATCANLMKGLLCSECDPYSAHLYGDEYQTPSKVPSLCHNYCAEFYTACSSVNMNWPSGTTGIFGSNPISTTYPTSEAFCTKFYSSVAPDYCYNGTVFQPIPPPPVPAGTPEICLEHFMPNGIAEDEQMLWLADPHDNSGRLFAVYKRGEVIAVNRTTGDALGRFMLISDIVYGGELGLLSITFHPNYATNRKFYAYYITSSVHAPCQTDDICGGSSCVAGECTGNWTSIVSEFQSFANDPTSADMDSERILLTVNQPFANHKAGGLHFGPDGYLYIPFGDGGSGNDPNSNAQNLDRWHGKMLRIDVNSQDTNLAYHVPEDNPFPNAGRPEIWAYGLRNPWRCSFDKTRPTYHICGDVGQDMYEEVDLIVKGGNFGWRRYEGDHVNEVNAGQPAYPEIKPILEYNHTDPRLGSGPSVIGGYFYRGNKDTCNYGRYIYCDWTGPLFSAVETSDGSGTFTTASLSYQCAADSPLCAGIGNILSFSEDDNGDLYILGHEEVMRVADASRCPNLVTCGSTSTSTSSPASSTTGVSSTGSSPSQSQSTPASTTGTSANIMMTSSGSVSDSTASCSSAGPSASSLGDGPSLATSADTSSAPALCALLFAPVALFLSL